MKKAVLLVIGLVLAPGAVFSQDKPVIVVNPFTTAQDVALPYDTKQLQAQTVAEFKVMIGKDFDIVAETPATAKGSVYALNVEITGWRAGNAAKRILVGLGSGREAADIQYHVSDKSGKNIIEQKDTVRTNFISNQYAGSSGTLAHPFAQKIAERIDKAKLK